MEYLGKHILPFLLLQKYLIYKVHILKKNSLTIIEMQRSERQQSTKDLRTDAGGCKGKGSPSSLSVGLNTSVDTV